MDKWFEGGVCDQSYVMTGFLQTQSQSEEGEYIAQ
jgi:hypothetical protein